MHNKNNKQLNTESKKKNENEDDSSVSDLNILKVSCQNGLHALSSLRDASIEHWKWSHVSSHSIFIVQKWYIGVFSLSREPLTFCALKN